MSGSSCGPDNQVGSAFCETCGAHLERRCSGCGAAVSPGARFCRSCGAELAALGAAPGPAHAAALSTTHDPRTYTPKHLADRIVQSRSALEGERKQVTVFFADVKGSLELAEQLDPEQWHRILAERLARELGS